MHIPSIKDTSSIAMSPVYEKPLIPSKVIYVTINDCWLVLKILFSLKVDVRKDGLTAPW